MENKLTNEEKAEIFKLYLGHEFVFDKEEPEILDGVTLSGVVYSDQADDSGEGIYGVEDCVLLLTPLSAISDEDAIQVAKIISIPDWRHDGQEPTVIRNEDYVLMNTSGYRFVTIFHNGTLMYKDKDGVDCYTLNAFMAYQYLISKGYAVSLWFAPDHWANGKTAIELNIAIEKG